MQIAERLKPVIDWAMGLRLVRVILHYLDKLGPILAFGLSYQAIFAVFAALWVAFAVAGFIVQGDPALLDAVYNFISTNIPGLIGDGSGNGAISRETLADTEVLNITGLVAAVGLAFTALGWIASGRSAIRSMFGLDNSETNFLLLKLKDAGLAVGFGIAVLASAALSVASTAALNWVLDLVSINQNSLAARTATQIIAVAVVFVLDAATLGVFYRIISGVRIPFRLLAQGTIIAALALGALKFGGSFLLDGATRNPLLASFAVIIGLLIWFNLICQIILVGSAWIAISADDADVEISGNKLDADAERVVKKPKTAEDPASTESATHNLDARGNRFSRTLRRIFRRDRSK